jgi:hypothetical protein
MKPNKDFKKEIAILLCEEDWKRIIQALRNEAYQLTQESNRAQEYATLLWEECAYHNALSDQIDYEL